MGYQNGQPVIVRLTVVETRDRGRLVLSPGPKADDYLTISEDRLEAIEVRAPVSGAVGTAKAKIQAKAGRANVTPRRVRRSTNVQA